MDERIAQQLRREYVEARISFADPIEVIALLFQIAVESLNDCIVQLHKSDRFARARSVTRAEEALHELLAALDHSAAPSFARTSAGLYRYVLQKIVAGHAEESEQAFREAISLLQPLASAWAELKSRLTRAPEPEAPESSVEPEPVRSEAKDPYAAYRAEPALTGSRDWS